MLAQWDRAEASTLKPRSQPSNDPFLAPASHTRQDASARPPNKLVSQWEMINWCIRNPVQGQPLDPADAKMTALQAYVAWERRGGRVESGETLDDSGHGAAQFKRL